MSITLEPKNKRAAKRRFLQLAKEYDMKKAELQHLYVELIRARSAAGLDDQDIEPVTIAEIPERIYGRNFNNLD